MVMVMMMMMTEARKASLMEAVATSSPIDHESARHA
jgi:hypothetical protein